MENSLLISNINQMQLESFLTWLTVILRCKQLKYSRTINLGLRHESARREPGDLHPHSAERRCQFSACGRRGERMAGVGKVTMQMRKGSRGRCASVCGGVGMEEGEIKKKGCKQRGNYNSAGKAAAHICWLCSKCSAGRGYLAEGGVPAAGGWISPGCVSE